MMKKIRTKIKELILAKLKERFPLPEEPPQEDMQKALYISPEDLIVRNEVARTIEASFGKVIWEAQSEDVYVEVMVSRVFPVHIPDADTYVCMVGLMDPKNKVEESVIPLFQFLTGFRPKEDFEFTEYDA